MERTSYWITIDEPDGTMMHVTQTMEETIEYLYPLRSKDFSVEKVTEDDATTEVKFMLGCREASGDAWQTE